jgi:histidinol-phosphate aminotransferase
VPADWITLGNGSNDILEIAAHAFVEKGQSIVYAQYSFAVYALATQGSGRARDRRAGCQARSRPRRDARRHHRRHAPDLRRQPEQPDRHVHRRPGARGVSRQSAAQCRWWCSTRRTPNIWPAEKRYDSIAWVRRYPNLLVSRTFSKAFGLAGLRVGFAIAQPELTDLLNRLRQPFNVNTLAQAAAIAALNDKAFLEKSAALNAQGYRRLTEAIRQARPRVCAVVGQLRAGARRQ